MTLARVVRLRSLVGVVAVVLGVSTAVAVLADNHALNPVASVVFALVQGRTFTGVGLVAWRRRPDSGVGVLMCAVGLSWLLMLLIWSNQQWLFVVGAMFNAVPLVL